MIPKGLMTLAEVQAAPQPNAKPEPQKRTNARKKRAARKFVGQLRQQVVARAHERCERCGQWCADWGHAHHRIPRSRGGQWTLENIEYVCPSCHREAHLTNTL